MDGWTVQWRMVVKPDLKSKRGDCQWIFLGGEGRLSAFSIFFFVAHANLNPVPQTQWHTFEQHYMKWPSSPCAFDCFACRHIQMGCVSWDAKRRDLVKWEKVITSQLEVRRAVLVPRRSSQQEALRFDLYVLKITQNCQEHVNEAYQYIKKGKWMIGLAGLLTSQITI